MKIQKLSDVYQPLIKKEDQVQSLLGAKKDLSERRVIGFFGQDKVYDALEDHYNKLQKAIKDGRLTEEMLEDDSYLYENIDFVIINPSFPLTEIFSDPWGFIGRIYNYPNNKPILVRYDMVTMDHKNIANYIPHENIFVFCIKYPTLKKIVEHGSIPHDIMVRWSSSFEHEAQHHFGHIYNMVKNEISKPYEEKEDEIRSRWAQVQQMLRNLGPSDSFISYIDHIFMNKEKWRKGIDKQLFIDEINRLIYKYSMLVLGVLNEGHNSVDMAYKVLQGKFTKQAIGEFIKLLEENNFDSTDMDLHKVLNASDLHEKRMRNIEKLAKNVLKIPPAMERNFIDFVKYSYNHFVNKYNNMEFPSIKKPGNFKIYDCGDEGMVAKIPVDFQDWYFDETKDELFDKLFEVQDWAEGEDSHRWDEALITVIFNVLEADETGYSAQYDHRSKLLQVYPSKSMFSVQNENQYNISENELVSITLHEGVHVAQNIFNTLKKFDFPGKVGVGKKEKYDVVDKYNILDPMELDSYAREAAEYFKSIRETNPNIDINRLIKGYFYIWLPDKFHKLRLNPEIFETFFAKTYSEIMKQEDELKNQKKSTSNIEINDRLIRLGNRLEDQGLKGASIENVEEYCNDAKVGSRLDLIKKAARRISILYLQKKYKHVYKHIADELISVGRSSNNSKFFDNDDDALAALSRPPEIIRRYLNDKLPKDVIVEVYDDGMEDTFYLGPRGGYLEKPISGRWIHVSCLPRGKNLDNYLRKFLNIDNHVCFSSVGNQSGDELYVEGRTDQFFAIIMDGKADGAFGHDVYSDIDEWTNRRCISGLTKNKRKPPIETIFEAWVIPKQSKFVCIVSNIDSIIKEAEELGINIVKSSPIGFGRSDNEIDKTDLTYEDSVELENELEETDKWMDKAQEYDSDYYRKPKKNKSIVEEDEEDYVEISGSRFDRINKLAEEFIRYVIQGRDEPSHFIYGPFMTEEEAKVWGWWTWAGDSAEEQFRTITYGEEWEYLLRQQDPKTREVDEESSKLFPIDKLPLWQSYFIKQYAKDGRLSFGQLKSAINEVLSGDHGNGKNRSGDPGLNLALDVLYVLRERGLAKQFGEY